MSGSTLLLFAPVCAALFLLGRRRALFPYLLVFVLGLEYFSPGAADSLFTIPKMGFLSLVLSQVGTTRLSRVLTTRGLTYPLVVFVGYMVMTNFWSVDPGRSLMRGTTLVLLVILFVTVQGFVRTSGDLHAFWRAFLLYGLANAAMTLYEVFSGTATYIEEMGVRAGGLGVNPTEGSFYTAISLLILMTYFGKGLPIADWISHAVVQLVAFGLLCAGMLATGSRGGIVGLVCAVVAMVFVSGGAARQRSRTVAKYLGLVLFAGVIVLAFPPVSELVVSRFASVGADQLGNRLVIWSELWGSILQHPVIGNGLNSTSIATSRYAQTVTYSAHNTPLSVLLDGGAVGLLLFFFLLLRIVTILRRTRRVGPPDLQFHGTVLSVVVVLAGVVMLSHDMMFMKLLWTLLGLMEGTHLLMRQQRDKAGRIPPRFHEVPMPARVAS